MPRGDARHKAHIARQNAARNAAFRRLTEAHEEEYKRLYYEECEKVGITPRPHFMKNRKKAAELAAEVRASGVLDGVVTPPLPDRFVIPEPGILAQQRLLSSEMMNVNAARIPELPDTPPPAPARAAPAEPKPFVPPPPPF